MKKLSYKDLIKKTAIEQSQMLRNKEVSSVELVNTHFERIEEVGMQCISF